MFWASRIRIDSAKVKKGCTHHAHWKGYEVVYQEPSLLGKAHACFARHDAKPRDKFVETFNDCSPYGRHQDKRAEDEESILGSLHVSSVALSIR